MRIKEIKELLKLIEKSDVAEVEVTEGDYRVKITRNSAVISGGVQVQAPVAAPQQQVMQVPAQPQAEAPAVAAVEEKKEEVRSAENVYIVKAPLVGTFYRAPSPDAKPYVEVGDEVRKGQVLCIVEAMKLMNEIESEVDGVIRRIFPENAQSVEFGAPLFEIELR